MKMSYELEDKLSDVYCRIDRAKILLEVLLHYFESETPDSNFINQYREL